MWRCWRDPISSSFDRIPACDRHTRIDRQTVTETAYYRASMVSRGKNKQSTHLYMTLRILQNTIF